MRRKFTIFILSLFLVAGGSEAFANGRNDNRGGKGRQEQSSRNSGRNNSGNRNNGNSNRPGGKKNTKDNRGHNFDKHKKPGIGHQGNMKPGRHNPGGNSYRPGHGSAPVPPPPAPVMRPGYGASYHPGPALPPPPPRLPYMVRNLTRGCNDVAVWQVNPQTFAVRYSVGGQLFIQYVYPYTNVYGQPNVISVNWQPLSPWTLIPPIQLNINL